MLLVSSLANYLPNGRVRRSGPFAGRCVDYTNPETANHRKRWKRPRRDETAFINVGKNGHPFIGTTSRVTGNAKEMLAFVRSRAAGLEIAKPKKKWRPTPASFRLLHESLRICQACGTNDAMLAILASDFRLAGHTAKDRVWRCVAYLGRSRADFERAWAKEPKIHTAQERAAAHGLTHDQFDCLDLRMSGCNTNPQERERLWRERWNVKRRPPGARAAEYAKRTEKRRAEAVEIRRQAGAEVVSRLRRGMTNNLVSSRTPDGVNW